MARLALFTSVRPARELCLRRTSALHTGKFLEASITRPSLIRGGCFRFELSAGIPILFLAVAAPWPLAPRLSLCRKHTRAGHTAGKYTCRRLLVLEFADYRTGNFNGPFHGDLPQEKAAVARLHDSHPAVGRRICARVPPPGARAVCKPLHESPEIVSCSVDIDCRRALHSTTFHFYSLPIDISRGARIFSFSAISPWFSLIGAPCSTSHRSLF